MRSSVATSLVKVTCDRKVVGQELDDSRANVEQIDSRQQAGGENEKTLDRAHGDTRSLCSVKAKGWIEKGDELSIPGRTVTAPLCLETQLPKLPPTIAGGGIDGQALHAATFRRGQEACAEREVLRRARDLRVYCDTVGEADSFDLRATI
jgi:hypothetical protein